MPDQTGRHGLPLIQPSQAQKHVTHNEAITGLDNLVFAAVQNMTTTTPPANPVDGVQYIPAAPATDDWAGQEGALATYVNGGWRFQTPANGWRIFDLSTGRLVLRLAGAWVDLNQSFDLLGINATADATNRLTVSSPATLFTHAGSDHQVKVNKNAPGDTASFLFQTAWSGRAEFGTTGDDDFHLKVSPDGSTWHDAMVIDKDTGTADLAAGATVDGQAAYHRGNVLGTVSETGGVPTGAIVESGSNADGEYVRFADGTQICTRTATMLTLASNRPFINTSANFAMPFISPPNTVVQLDILDYKANAEDNGGPSREELGIIGINQVTETSVTPRLYRIAGAANDFDTTTTALVFITAFGRWF